MILTDVHTHTTFSPDGKDDIYTMIAEAKRKKVAYYGIAEHFDYDYVLGGFSFDDTPYTFIDAESYFSTARKIQEQEKENIHILVGGEFGFTPDKSAGKFYQSLIERYKPDFVVNSVHSNNINDYYFADCYEGKTKEEAYDEYLNLVLQSVYAEYDYDIIAHLTYCSRYAPYPDKKLRYADFSKQIDSILKGIIERDKILEINSSARGAGSEFLPDVDILKRYYELGGRNISFASDAHFISRIIEKRELVIEKAKEIGFTHITVPCQGEKIKVSLL